MFFKEQFELLCGKLKTDTTSIGIANLNPIRYRGYYYDTDTGLYYLQSRYYNPQVGRFLNADNQLSTGGMSGYVTSKSQVPQTNGRGTLNPKVKSAIERGKEMHMQMDYGPGVQKEVAIAKGCRVDGIDFNNKIIYELKPNNPQAIAKGMKQLERYTTAANQSYGGEWTGVLKLYD
ncbi:MAG: RHS repeat-associated core domain-containing protein [Eubacterium sp.]